MKEVMRGILRTSYPLAPGGGKIRDPGNEFEIVLSKCDTLEEKTSVLLHASPRHFVN